MKAIKTKAAAAAAIDVADRLCVECKKDTQFSKIVRLKCCGRAVHCSCLNEEAFPDQHKTTVVGWQPLTCPYCNELYPTPGSNREWAILTKWIEQEKTWAMIKLANKIKRGHFKNQPLYSLSLIKDNYERAAHLNDPVGMGHLGRLYGDGSFGVDRCDEMAVRWWKQAAAMGDPVSILCLEIFSNSKQLVDTCFTGDLNDVKVLLKLATNANFQREDGWTPLLAACGKGFVNIVKALLARKLIRINQSSVSGATPLSMACENGHVMVVRVLLARHEILITADMFAFSTSVLKMDRIITSICDTCSKQDFESTTSFCVAFADRSMIARLKDCPMDVVRHIFRFFGCPENKRCTHQMIRAHYIGECKFEEQLWKECPMDVGRM